MANPQGVPGGKLSTLVLISLFWALIELFPMGKSTMISLVLKPAFPELMMTNSFHCSVPQASTSMASTSGHWASTRLVIPKKNKMK